MKKIYWQFSKFAGVGLINTAIDFCIYTGLTRFFLFWNGHKIIAMAIAFTIANINSYIFNKFWTFQNQEKKYHIQYFKFLIISLIGLGITEIIFYFCHWQLNLYDLIAKLIAVPFVLFWNFIANKYWTFKTRQN